MMKNYFQQNVLASEADPIDFRSFDSAFHENPEQIRRRLNAKKIKAENITDAGDHYEIIGSSGDTYIVTLNHCSCFDFASRHLPCKHIYRFALDHKIIEDFPKIKPKNSKIFAARIDSEIDHFRSAYNDGLISAEKFLKIVDAIQKGK